MRFLFFVALVAILGSVHAQYDSRSTGADGALEFFAPPTSRYETAAVFDAARAEFVLFGGWDGSRTNDTWIFDGSKWALRPTQSAPSPRNGHAMVYDSVREVVILFGGQTDTNVYSDEIWEWDGIDWTVIDAGQPKPSARELSAIAFDPTANTGNGGVYIYGGQNSSEMIDTWEFANGEWDQKADGPAKRTNASMVYDPVNDHIVMFGGCTTRNSASSSTDTTWIYAGGFWTELEPGTKPEARRAHEMVWDSASQRIVLFGGELGLSPYNEANDLYAWDGSNWARIFVEEGSPEPLVRRDCAFAYDPVNQQFLVAGGVTSTNTRRDDTWTFTIDAGTDLASWAQPPNAMSSPVFDMSGRNSGIWNFTTITVPAGVTVTFAKNAENTPVIWRASGNVNIFGDLELSGEDAGSNRLAGFEAQSGPGGFAGGLGGIRKNASDSYAGTAGKGPGGGFPGIGSAEAGGHAAHAISPGNTLDGVAYGSALADPIVGGSGGGGGGSSDTADGGNGGAGGGAIHVAASGTIRLDGTIRANGGDYLSGGASLGGRGSGGTIKLSAEMLIGSGSLEANNNGRRRIESFDASGFSGSTAGISTAPPITEVIDDLDQADLVIIEVGPATAPAAPSGNVRTPDVILENEQAILIRVQTRNVPVGTGVEVVVAGEGGRTTGQGVVDANGLVEVNMIIPPGVGTIQASTTFTAPQQ